MRRNTSVRGSGASTVVEVGRTTQLTKENNHNPQTKKVVVILGGYFRVIGASDNAGDFDRNAERAATINPRTTATPQENPIQSAQLHTSQSAEDKMT